VPSISPQQLADVVAEAISAINGATTGEELKQVRTQFVADGSPISLINATLRDVPAEEKAEAGKIVGQARGEINQAFAAREALILQAEEHARLLTESVDVTAVASKRRVGARHPLTLLMEEMSNIFVGMGWEVAEGPELENEWFNFDALNFDEDHPARAMQDTFFVEPVDRHLVLRTHTSPVQIRSLLSRELPVYVVAPGRVYRTDELDATHTPVFHQMEGIAIDKGLTMAHLKGTLEHLARAMFGDGARIRLRPNYFPFTEPSAELDIWHPTFRGGARWIEWGGCGMVNPKVLATCGIDTDVYTGFAFGMGLERTLMVRHGITDMHDIVEGDLRFTRQFGVGL